jgi:hypothetical protein
MAVASEDGDPEIGQGDPAFMHYIVFFGRRTFSPVTTVEAELEQGGACEVVGPSTWDVTVHGIGDQNSDGKDDLAVLGSPWGMMGPVVESGRFHVIYGRTRNELAQLRSPPRNSDFDVTFTASPGYTGWLSSAQGGRDFNCDGKPDILLADLHNRWAPPPSRAVVIFGGDLEEKAGPLSELADSMELVNYRSESGDEGNKFPVRFDFAGDVNGDGYEDLVAYDRVRAYVYFNPLIRLDLLFVRGDANQDGGINIGDAIFVLQNLFASGPPIPCLDAADANDDESMNIADGIYLLQNLFANGPPLPLPVDCGPDPGGEALDCRDSICR